MNRMMKSTLPTLLLALVFAARLPAQVPPTPDETARFLAGLPVPDSALEPLTRQRAWVEHAAEFEKAWKDLEARQFAKIRVWAPEILGAAHTAKDPVFHLFSGPDILCAQAFFPNAVTYVLAGPEPVGTLPDLEHLPPATLAAGLANLRKSLHSALGFSFLQSKEMRVDLRHQQLSGTLPILCLSLARAGCSIREVELLGLNKYGVTKRGPSRTPGVKIRFTRGAGAEQSLYYFTTDLSDDGIQNEPGFMKFCDDLGTGRSLVKAASYVLHTDGFSTVRDFLLTHSSTLVEDDSGIPLRDFVAEKWNLRYFGAYSGPMETFKEHHQPAMAAVYQEARPPALPFSFGYRWHARESSLILATPK